MAAHNDAPQTTLDPQADITDFYAFTSRPNPNGPISEVNFLLNVFPGAGLADSFSSDLDYQIAIDRDGDDREDTIYRTRFGPASADGRQSAQLDVVDVASGVVTSLVDTTTNAIGSSSNFTHFLFAGLRDDPFFGSTHDIRHFADSGDASELTGNNEFAGENVMTIAVRVPLSDVTLGGVNPSVNVWTRTIDGDGNQLDRAGRPLLNSLVLSREDAVTHRTTSPETDRGNFRNSVIAQVKSLSNDTYTDTEAAALADTLLPDVLTLDTRQPGGYPNGRKIGDDVVDLELARLTKGRVTTDGVDNDNPARDSFPYLGDVNLPVSPDAAPTVITDPAGDATSGRPDVIQVDASSDNVNVYIDVTFTADTNMDDLFGIIGLDTDQNASTGSPFGSLVGNPAIDIGIEVGIDFGDVPGTGLALLSSAQFPQGTSIPAQIDGQKLRLVIPLTLLGNDDGNLNLAGVTTDRFFAFDDYFPNSGSGTISVVVTNSAPIAGNDSATVRQGQPVTVDVLANDSDPDGDPIEVFEFDGGPGIQSIENNSDGSLTVTFFDDFSGTTTLEYSIRDTRGAVDSAVVSILVTPNTAPVAMNDSATTTQGQAVTVDVLANDSDPDGDPIEVVDFDAGPGIKSIENNLDGSLTVTFFDDFSGTTTLEYSIRDTRGAVDSAVVALNVEERTVIRIGADDAGAGQADDSNPDRFEIAFVVDGERVTVTLNNTEVLDMPADSIDTLTLDGSSDRDIFRVAPNPGGASFPFVIAVNGNDGNDLLNFAGLDSPVLLDAGAGNDTLIGGNANDTLIGGDGNDLIRGGDGDDDISDPGGRNRIFGGMGDDVIRGGSANDTIFGNAGNDNISDPSGRNRIFGGSGDDTLIGGANDDTIFGSAGDDEISDPSGRNRIFAGRGNDLIRGGRNNDLIHAGAGDDEIIDLLGRNLLFGGRGRDSINARQDAN